MLASCLATLELQFFRLFIQLTYLLNTHYIYVVKERYKELHEENIIFIISSYDTTDSKQFHNRKMKETEIEFPKTLVFFILFSIDKP